MLETIGQLAQRLCACGLLSALVLSLVRDSGQQAILRLCCASLTVIVVFTSLPSLRFSQSKSQTVWRQMEIQTQQALEQSTQAQHQAACRGVEQYLQSQAQQMGLECRISVRASLEQGNVFQLEQVEYRLEQPLALWQRQQLLKAAQQLGLAESQVAILEGGGPDEE